MLEQAVYAGRNHTSSLAVALLALCSTPAQAQEVAQLPYESYFEELIADADGSAWT